MTATAEGVGFAADAVRGLSLAWLGVRQAVAETTNAYVQFATVGARGTDWLAEKFGVGDSAVGRAAAKVTEFADSISMTTDSLAAEMNAKALEQMPSEKIKQWVEDVRAKAETAAQEVAANRKLNVLGDITGGGGAGDTAQETERIISAQRDRFSRIHEEMLLADNRVIELENYRKKRADLELEQDLERIRTKGLLTKDIEDEFRTAREQADKLHQGRLVKLEKTTQQSRLGMANGFFGNLAQVAAAANGKQSRMAKSAAIAQTVINTYQSATSAFSAMAGIPVVGPVLGAAAAAAAVSAGLANVQAIRSQSTPSFDGGGYTGAGARSGGLDGKGGFMAMLHPQETVVDHTKGQSVGGGSVVQLNLSVVNEMGEAANVDIEQRGENIRMHLRRFKEELDGEIQNVNGIGKTIQRTFKLAATGAH